MNLSPSVRCSAVRQFSCLLLGTCLFLVLMLVPHAIQAEPDGRAIYVARCAACHGEQGEGVPDSYPDPLVGDRSVLELADLITQTMPEGSPEECVGEEAHAVAVYIHEAFYSLTAQVRNRPPTLEFSRLTVRQYEHSIADIVGSFSSRPDWGMERGLRAEYYNDKRPRRDRRVIERIDSTIDFDFGETSPHDDIGVEEFSIRWVGSVFAEETGEYEFIIETPNAARLWVNNDSEALIDAGVRSGDDRIFRATIRLLAGRAYPLRLEFYKIKEPTASIRLSWAVPHHVEQVIPSRNLSTVEFPETLVVTTRFPPDDRSMGYERGAFVSPEWIEATTHAALEVAGRVADRVDRLAGIRNEDDRRDEKLREFCNRFVEQAFRRPLSEEERTFFVDRQFTEAPDSLTAVKRVILLALKSPRFLYRELGRGDFDAYAVASWISYGVWDSIPDRPLLEAAARNELQTPEQIASQVERMLDDLRTRGRMREFFQEWLEFHRCDDLSKDNTLFPEFDEALVSDMRTSLELFVDDVVWSPESDYRRLLLDERVFLTPRLAELNRVPWPEGETGFRFIPLPDQGRAGVLSHPYLLSGFAYHAATSPIHRGVFVARNLLGRRIKPPPIAVSPEPPEAQPGLSTRERVALQTSPAVCHTCHGLINPLGFALEEFDAIGRYRDSEEGRPIDASGSYLSRHDERFEFQGSRELAEFLADSPEAHQAFVERLFQHLVKQPLPALSPTLLEELTLHFQSNDYHIRGVIVEMLTRSAIALREIDSQRSIERATSAVD